MKNNLDGINSRLDTAGKTISVLESIIIETVRNKTETKSSFFLKGQRISELRNNLKQTNITGVPQREGVY